MIGKYIEVISCYYDAHRLMCVVMAVCVILIDLMIYTAEKDVDKFKGEK